MARHALQGRALLLAATAIVAVMLLPGATAAGWSELWGRRGELWDLSKLPDFSFAGYRQGNEDLPRPPVTRNVTDFREPGSSDTEMLEAALAWAHEQPLTEEHIVLYIPDGNYTLTKPLEITRSRLVLRGAGRQKTKLVIPRSLTDVLGPSDESGTGGYVNFGGFVAIRGTEGPGKETARVLQGRQGEHEVEVDSADGLEAGQYYVLHFTDVDGRFNDLMFDNLHTAPSKYRNSQRVSFTTKVVGVDGTNVTLERPLPYDILDGVNEVTINERPDTVHDSGVEGVSFQFKWAPYGGHHVEEGWNAVELSFVRDCWVRDISTVNADSGVLIYGSNSVTVSGIKMRVTQTRMNNIPNKWDEPTDYDGHWGVQFTHSFDVLVERFDIRCSMVHDVGTGSSSKWGVFMNGKMSDGNLDLHRALAGPTLYTNIDVGKGTNAIYSGGPPRSGPNALAGTTWWTIISDQVINPPENNQGPAGDCNFGPVVNLVNVNIKRSKARSMCKTWHYERAIRGPENLYYAQRELRRQRAQQAAER